MQKLLQGSMLGRFWYVKVLPFFLDLKAFELETTNRVRKYIWIFDIFFSWLFSKRKLLYVNSYSNIAKAQVSYRFDVQYFGLYFCYF